MGWWLPAREAGLAITLLKPTKGPEYTACSNEYMNCDGVLHVRLLDAAGRLKDEQFHDSHECSLCLDISWEMINTTSTHRYNRDTSIKRGHQRMPLWFRLRASGVPRKTMRCLRAEAVTATWR